jgi:hypothetical protein
MARLDRVIGGITIAVNDSPVERGNDDRMPILEMSSTKF